MFTIIFEVNLRTRSKKKRMIRKKKSKKCKESKNCRGNIKEKIFNRKKGQENKESDS